MSGESDFLMKIICADMKRYVEINEQLVGNSRYQVTINSYVVMKENKPFRGVDLITLSDHSEHLNCKACTAGAVQVEVPKRYRYGLDRARVQGRENQDRGASCTA